MDPKQTAPATRPAACHDDGSVTKKTVTREGGVTRVEEPIHTTKDFREPKGFT